MTQFQREVYAVAGKPGQVGVRIERFRIGFEVIKSDDSAVNTAKLAIYNLSEATAQATRVEGAAIELFAGYRGAPGLIFLGDITRSFTEREGTETICRIESGDGNNARNKSVALTLRGEQKLGPVLKKITDVAGLAFDAAGIDVDTTLPKTMPVGRGLALHGGAFDAINRVCKLNRLDWTVEDGRLVIVRQNKATRLPAIVINQDTGMIGSPQQGDRRRLVVKTLLNPEFRLRRIVRVQSRLYDGWYLIRRIKHWGDSGYDTAFYSELECTEIAR